MTKADQCVNKVMLYSESFKLPRMGSFRHSKRSDSKQCTVEVRWGNFYWEFYCIFIPKSGRKYSHTKSYDFTMTLISRDALTAGAWAACGLTDWITSLMQKYLQKITKSNAHPDKSLPVEPWLLFRNIIISQLELRPPVDWLSKLHSLCKNMFQNHKIKHTSWRKCSRGATFFNATDTRQTYQGSNWFYQVFD